MGHPELIFILFCHFEGGTKRFENKTQQYLCVHIACVASHLFVKGGGPILLKIRMIMKFLAKTTTTPYRWQNVRAGPARTWRSMSPLCWNPLNIFSFLMSCSVWNNFTQGALSLW